MRYRPVGPCRCIGQRVTAVNRTPDAAPCGAGQAATGKDPKPGSPCRWPFLRRSDRHRVGHRCAERRRPGYIAAFDLDEGETIGGLLVQGPPTPALAHLEMDKQGFAWLPEDDFVNHFAADVDPVKARVMHAMQQPLAWSALDEVMGVPAWKSHPCWFTPREFESRILRHPDLQEHRSLAARAGVLRGWWSQF